MRGFQKVMGSPTTPSVGFRVSGCPPTPPPPPPFRDNEAQIRLFKGGIWGDGGGACIQGGSKGTHGQGAPSFFFAWAFKVFIVHMASAKLS